MSTDTKLTDLVVNTLTRKQYHDADLTDHGDELFVQSDHAGVFVGGDGVDALDTTNITNCITNIPQDIKLELNAGALTLKAGSKVYVPNGFEQDGVTRKFDEIVISNDTTSTQPLWGAYTYFAIWFENTVRHIQSVAVTSGSVAPTPIPGHWWYDTGNNKIKRVPTDGSAWEETGASLPMALVTSTDGTTVASIDQVFNGFGYIGSTVFVLPGVKALIPNEFNADGSMNSIAVETTEVLTTTMSSNPVYKNCYFYLFKDSFGLYLNNSYYVAYNQNKNINYNTISGGKTNCVICGWANFTNKINWCHIKTAFHAVDYSDTGFIAHQATPSDKYINLTVGASGATYTAPADGWFSAYAESTSAVQHRISLDNPNKKVRSSAFDYAGWGQSATIPVCKGDVITYTYQAAAGSFSMNTLTFIYSNGSI